MFELLHYTKLNKLFYFLKKLLLRNLISLNTLWGMLTWVMLPKKEALKAELEGESLWPPRVDDPFLILS